MATSASARKPHLQKTPLHSKNRRSAATKPSVAESPDAPQTGLQSLVGKASEQLPPKVRGRSEPAPPKTKKSGASTPQVAKAKATTPARVPREPSAPVPAKKPAGRGVATLPASPPKARKTARKPVKAVKPAQPAVVSVDTKKARGGQVSFAFTAASKRVPAQGAAPQGAARQTRPVTDDAATVKAKRSRVPKNFADQYTVKPAKQRRSAAPATESAKAQRARRDAAERERLRQLMAPSDDVLRRLSRIGAIAPSPLATDESAAAARKSSGTKIVRRPSRWESRCGKCGTTGTFKAAAGLCARCGAIAVRMS